MKPSRTFWTLIAVVQAAVAIISIQLFRSHPSHFNIAKLMVAGIDYTQQLKKTGASPSEVSLNQISRGLLTSADVNGYTGTKVTVTLATDPQNPNQLLVRVRMRDGREILSPHERSPGGDG